MFLCGIWFLCVLINRNKLEVCWIRCDWSSNSSNASWWALYWESRPGCRPFPSRLGWCCSRIRCLVLWPPNSRSVSHYSAPWWILQCIQVNGVPHYKDVSYAGWYRRLNKSCTRVSSWSGKPTTLERIEIFQTSSIDWMTWFDRYHRFVLLSYFSLLPFFHSIRSLFPESQ